MMRRTLVVTLLLMVAALPLFAQSLTGTVAGTVKDEQGGLLPGVSVTLTGKTGSRSTVTDAEGAYRFAAVDPGTYSVTAELQSFRPKRQDNVIVSVAKVVDVNLALAVGGKTESVEVVGETPVVDVASSATDSTLSQDMLFNLPIRPTNAAVSMLNYLPGINNESAYGGNATYGNGLLIDGVDTRDPDAGSAWVFFNYDLMDEIAVGGLGAPAEYGSYTGAIVNTIMKSGGNRYSGLFNAYWTKDSLWSNNVSAGDVSKNPSLADPAVVNKRLDLTGQVGGPIVPDKLFFFVAAQRYQQHDNPSGPLQVHSEVSPRINAKVTWQPTPNDNVATSFQWDNYNQTGRCSVSAALCQDQPGSNQTLKQDSPEAVWGVQWRHLFGTKTFSEVKYSGWWGYYYTDPAVNSPASWDASTSSWSGGGLYHYYADRLRHQVNASLSHYAEAFGKHDLKFGLEIERSKVRNQFGYTGGGYYYDYTAYYPKGQYLVYDYGYDSEGHNQRESFYLQDAWKPTSRLTINAGVRVDFIRGRSAQLNKTIFSATDWAPRIGFAFDATGDSKTVVKGHYGQYYEDIFNQEYVRAMPGYTDFVGYSYDPAGSKCMPGGNCFTESSRLLYPLYTVDPKMKQPRVDEWTAGIERAVGTDMKLQVTGIYRKDQNIQGSVFPDARWTPNVITNEITGRDMTVYQWANQSESETTPMLTNPDGFVYRDENGNVLGTARAQRKYKALMFELDKRFTHRWQGRISYVYSKSEGSINNNSYWTYGQNTLFETPTRALNNAYGLPQYDSPHEVKVYATWQIPRIELALSGYYSYLSGTTWTPYQQFKTKEINYPTSSGRRPLLEPFGNRRLDATSNLDLRLEKIFKVGGGSDRIAVYADILNVFNTDSVVTVNARYPSVSIEGYDQPVAVGSPTELNLPRRVLLGARWSF